MYLSFANVSRSTVLDDSGNDNDGVMQGNVVVPWPAGQCGPGGRFKDGRIKFDGRNFKPIPSQAVTIAAWVKLDELRGRTHELFVSVDPNWRNPRFKSIYNFEINNQGVVYFSHRYLFRIQSSPVIRPNVWNHIVGAYDLGKNIAEIFVNGSLVSQKKASDILRPDKLNNDWSELAAIGKFNTGRSTRTLRGLLDEFYIFPCALTAGQVNAVKDKKCLQSRFILFSTFMPTKFTVSHHYIPL